VVTSWSLVSVVRIYVVTSWSLVSIVRICVVTSWSLVSIVHIYLVTSWLLVSIINKLYIGGHWMFTGQYSKKVEYRWSLAGHWSIYYWCICIKTKDEEICLYRCDIARLWYGITDRFLTVSYIENCSFLQDIIIHQASCHVLNQSNFRVPSARETLYMYTYTGFTYTRLYKFLYI